MSLSISYQRNHRAARNRNAAQLFIVSCLTALIALCVGGGAASAAEEEATDIWDALIHGKPTLNFRARVEVAKRDTQNQSEAYTFRTRLGYGTKPYKGFTVYGDFENIAAIASEQYYDGIGSNPRNLTAIPDPTLTEVNQIFLKYTNEKLLDTTVIGGRQRIILDDSRWVGNVGWRQNEQTYDGVLLQSKLGRDDTTATYSYVGNANSFLGTTVSANSHIFNGNFTGFEAIKLTGFIYLMEFADVALASSASFGLRGNGKINLTDDWSLGYSGSYAYQMNYGNQPVSYGANYVWVDINTGFKDYGKLGGGFELLGTDDGKQQIRTLLATKHKFNGWADAFVDNGGKNGLRDMFFYIAPNLPWKIKSKLVYHRFWNDSDGLDLGYEIDAMLKRAINKHLDLMLKGAWFSAASKDLPLRKDIYRFWAEATLKF